MFRVENSHSIPFETCIALFLNVYDQMPAYPFHHFSAFRADELATYITDNHHRYTRQSAEVIHERLHQLMSREDHARDEYRHLWNLFDLLFHELDNHMRKEETILFPFVRKMVQVLLGTFPHDFPEATMIKKPIELLLKEHRRISLLLQEIRLATSYYKPADDASDNCRFCLAEMFDLDQDIQKHFYLEETVLYPKILSLEESIALSGPGAGTTSAS